MGWAGSLAVFLTGLWVYGGYYYLEESIGFENLLLFLPHEIGQFLVGFFAPPFMLWLLVLQLAGRRELRALSARLHEAEQDPQPEDEQPEERAPILKGQSAGLEESRAATREPQLTEGGKASSASDAIRLEPDGVEPEAAEPDTVEPDTVEPDPVETDTVEPKAVEPDPVEPDVVVPELVAPEEMEAELSADATPEPSFMRDERRSEEGEPRDVADLQKEADEAMAGPEPAFPGEEDVSNHGDRPPRRPAEVHTLRGKGAERADRRPPRRPSGGRS